MKRLLIPGLILIAIAAIWLFQSKMETKRTSPRSIENFLKLDQEEINRITVKTAADFAAFSLKNGRWYIDDAHPKLADSAAVENMITSSINLKVGNVISENPERQRDFMVDSITGNFIQFYNGDKLLSSIFIGKMTSDYSHSYVRKPGSKEVYLSEGLLTYIFNRRRAQWLNRNILSFQPANVREVEFIYPDKSILIRHSITEWYVSKSPYTDSLPTDSMKTDVFLRQAGNLKASDFANESDSGKINFGLPAMTMKATLLDGTAQTVEFASADSTANRYYCRRPDIEDVFVISGSAYDNMLKEFADFLPE